MADYEVSLSNYNLDFGGNLSYGISLDNFSADPFLNGGIEVSPTEVYIASGNGGVMSKLGDLSDVVTNNLSSTTNQYVLVYDAPSNAFKFVNPDRVIDAAVGVLNTDPTPVGLTTSTINYFDTELDNKIDLDGGVF